MKGRIKYFCIITLIILTLYIHIACESETSIEKKTYTVTFIANDGSEITNQIVIEGEQLNEPILPSRYGYVFGGWYRDNETFTIKWDFKINTVIASIALFGKWIPTMNVGDTGPGGGIIYYRSETGFTMIGTQEINHYLEVAPTGFESLAWASLEKVNSNISSTGSRIGDGRRNTNLILSVDENAPAAKACKDYTNNNMTDWFLPSSM